MVGLPTLVRRGLPLHHTPGVKLPFLQPSNSLSILSNTRVSILNSRANAAPLLIIFAISLREGMGMLFRGEIPRNIVHVVVDNSRFKLWSIADNSLKIAFR